jgi:signal transduction histidine kinase/CheY-like chemotaxis protein
VALWRRHVQAGAPFRTSYRLTRQGAPNMWVAAAAEIVAGDDGEPERIVGVLKNIDREKRAEQGMMKALESAEAANRAKNEFLANMSHEIRTPLNGVMGIASVLGRTQLTASQKEMVDLIGASAQTLEALLSDVLDLARIESGRFELRDEVFDLGEALRLVAALFEPKAKEKGLVFKTVISPAARAVVRGDVIRLRQIVSNLLSNAVKFTDKGRVVLHVEAEPSAQGVRIKLSVIDTGMGFDAETGRRLFQRFEQADGSITRRFGGTGLGLAISKSLAEAMGGDLSAASTPGKGAVFTLVASLPLADADSPTPVMGAADMALAADLRRALAAAAGEEEANADAPGLGASAALAAPSAVGRSAMRILLAEDHITNRKVVNLILDSIGVDLTNVENGQQAVEAAASGAFDLILMDMQMPVMDGLSAIRAIRNAEQAEGRARTPILALTANAMAQDALASEAAGADGHLTKPIGADKLIDAINAVRDRAGLDGLVDHLTHRA